jgi:DNA polymerase I-like protein with 3'-5' exonuclease and polymerase domains
MLAFNTRLNSVTEEMEFNGVQVDQEVAKEIFAELQKMKEEAEATLYSLIIKNTPDDFDDSKLNLGSPVQMAELLYSHKFKDSLKDDKGKVVHSFKKEWSSFMSTFSSRRRGAISEFQQMVEKCFDKLDYGFNIKPNPEFSGKGGFGAGKAVIEALLGDEKLSKKARAFAEAYTSLSKINTWIDLSYWQIMSNVSPDGKVHGSFVQAGTASGRYSSSSPNMQNLPSKDKNEGKNRVRELICSRWGDQGCILAPDFSQLEIRILMELCKSKQGIEDFNNGMDIHTATATDSANFYYGAGTWDSWDEAKQKAWRSGQKTVNFGLIYGAMPKNELEQAQYDGFMTRYKEVLPWNEQVFAQVEKFGYYECPMTGFRYNLSGATHSNFKRGYDSQGRGWRNKALNYPVQGTAGRVVQASMIGIYDDIVFDDKIKFVGQVHDENLLDVHLSALDRAIEVCYKNMEGVQEVFKRYFGYSIEVPLAVDMEAGYNWFDVMEVDKFKEKVR